MTSDLSRRTLMTRAALGAGTLSLLAGGLSHSPAGAAQGPVGGTVHSFRIGDVTFHSYVSPAEALSVTAQVVEFADRLLLVDATMLPATAGEVGSLIESLGKPVELAVLSHEHPDHWGGAAALGLPFATLTEVREGMRPAATSGKWPTPENVLEGPSLEIGRRDIAGVPVEFRHYANTEAPHMVVAVLPEQKVAILQDLVYNGVYFAPGADRAEWISTLKALRNDPACETLLVGHGLPTSRGELDTAIAYLQLFDEVMTTAPTPDAAIAAMKSAYPGYRGDFLLGLISKYWTK